MLWKKAFHAFDVASSSAVKEILILGVGGGTVIYMLHDRYPNASIVGIDIDQTMLDIGKTYFGLSTIDSLRLVQKNAKTAVHDFVKKGQQFDMVIVDLFSGRHIPEFVSSRGFLKTVAAILSPRGIVYINYLRELEYREKSEQLYKIVNTLFSHVRDYPIVRNRFFCMVK